MRLGFIGAGRVGLPMVQPHTATGHEVRALGRTPAERSPIARAAPGVRSPSGIREVAENSEAVLACVFSDDQVREACLATPLLDALAPTRSSSCTPRAVPPRSRRSPPKVPGWWPPVSGSTHDFAAGCRTLFSGGADGTVGHVLPALEAYTDPVLHVGPLASGQRDELLDNALFEPSWACSPRPYGSGWTRRHWRSVAAFSRLGALLPREGHRRRTRDRDRTRQRLLDVAIRTTHSKQSLRHQGDTAHGTC
ncbi:NAD(P)-binding domain-containing protein [Streptomyces sp. NPDC102405]|uniref:NAD(P)-binding domain-containing protein n=1 Tax=Streptomyces sp. NPDC102405 TaxID=3366170 RepID=UPI00382758EA